MEVIRWTTDLDTGIEEVDKQHQKLVRLINSLNEGIKARKKGRFLKEILDELIIYCQDHFEAEEKLFKTYKYPEQTAHEEEHIQFIKKAFEFKKQLNEGQLCLSMDVYDYLADWLISHIKESDQAFVPYIIKQ